MDSAIGVAEVTIEPGPAERIAVLPEQIEMQAGNSTRFTATIYDAFGNVTPGQLTWSLSDGPILGELSSDAEFNAQKAGQGHIIAAMGAVSGQASFRILPGELAEIIAEVEEIVLTSGQQSEIKTFGLDNFGNRMPIEPIFQIIPANFGRIESKNNLFAAIKIGSGLIKASVGELSAEIPVRVEPGELTSMGIQLPEVKIMAGKTYPLKAIGYDTGKNIISVKPQWAVSQNIGTIDTNTGLFNAQKVGTGTLVAYSGEIMATAIIEVMPGDLFNLFIDPNPVTVKSDEIESFQISGYDVEENRLQLSQSAVEWDTIGGTGLIEQPGIFRGTRMGKGKVVAHSGNLLAEAYVTVLPGEPEARNCRIRVLHPVLPADGGSFSDVIFEVRDKYHNPVPGIKVTLVSSRQADEIIQPAETNENGISRGRASSRQTGKSIIRGVIGGISFTDTAQVEFR